MVYVSQDIGTSLYENKRKGHCRNIKFNSDIFLFSHFWTYFNGIKQAQGTWMVQIVYICGYSSF